MRWMPSTMEGTPVTDCSSFVELGLNLGASRGAMTAYRFSGIVGANTRTSNLHGRTVPSYLVRVLPNGNMTCTPPVMGTRDGQSRKVMDNDVMDMTAWGQTGHLRPGDIMLRSGHITTVLGVNQTGAPVVIPAHFTGRGSNITVPPGGVLAITSSTGNHQVTGLEHYRLTNYRGTQISVMYVPLRPAFYSMSLNPIAHETYKFSEEV